MKIRNSSYIRLFFAIFGKENGRIILAGLINKRI
jgi:hypothetical protein